MYATTDHVRAAIPPKKLVALCDDEGTGGAVADANPALVRAMKSAHSEVTSNLATIYENGDIPNEQPGQVSELLIDAEVAYVEFFLYKRKPELAAKIGESFLRDLWKFALDRIERIKNAVQEIAVNDNPPPQPPANVGGIYADMGAPKLGDDGLGGPYDMGDY